MSPRTLPAQIRADGVVAPPDDALAVLHVDLPLVHEVTAPPASAGLARGLCVRRPDRSGATMAHSTPLRASVPAIARVRPAPPTEPPA